MTLGCSHKKHSLTSPRCEIAIQNTPAAHGVSFWQQSSIKFQIRDNYQAPGDCVEGVFLNQNSFITHRAHTFLTCEPLLQ